MIHQNKKKLTKLLLLSCYLYLLPHITQCETHQAPSSVKKVAPKTQVKVPAKKTTPTTQAKTAPKATPKAKQITQKPAAPVEKKSITPIAPVVQEEPEEIIQQAPVKKEFPQSVDYRQRAKLHEEKRTINDIHVSGNVVITKNSIISRLPLKVGDIFNVNYTASMIKNLYKLGYFHQIKIYAEPIGDDKIDLYVVVQEKPRFKEMSFVGNKALTSKEIKEELKVSDLSTLVKEELAALISKIKKFYQKKNYHNTQVTGELIPTEDGQVSAEFTIKEGKKSYLTRISFKGNKHVSSKRLKRIIFSKEDWILGMLDRAGTYNPEMIEGDKAMIEDGYKSNGFANAKVIGVDVDHDDKNNTFHITYHVHEGDRYIVKSVEAPGNDILSEAHLKSVIPIFPGQLYSVEKIRTALEHLKTLWGESGYIFADIDPAIDIDDEDKTVSIKFHSDPKDQVRLNRLTIKGNKKARDKVVRRSILLEEGDLISTTKMEASKARVGLLNFFDQKDGVTWKTTRIDQEHADLDLILKEIKTGHFQFNLGYGGSPTNRATPQTGLNFNCSTGDRNLFGTGIAGSTIIEISKKYRAFNAALMNPWLFDKPIRGTINGFIKKSEYENFNIAEKSPNEQTIGGNIGLGYVSPRLNGILIDGQILFERINFEGKIKAANRFSNIEQQIGDFIIRKNFQEGSKISLLCNISQDRRNGIAFATNGHQWNWLMQLTVPGSRGCATRNQETRLTENARFQYFKSEFDLSWYTPLIGEHDLVLCLHANAGFIYKFKDKDVAWRDLYHIGGPTTVRGYTYGQVGPSWKDTSLGAKQGFNVNVEFIAPISSNLNTRGVIFYDGGAGWNTPYREDICKFDPNFGTKLKNDKFFYRHSVGIGVRIKSPSPMQVDFGIKLNPSKRFRKELTEMHLTVEHTF